MKRKFTEQEAIRLVEATSGIRIDGKRIRKDSATFRGFKGLTTCSAYDYLVNHCGYVGV